MKNQIQLYLCVPVCLSIPRKLSIYILKEKKNYVPQKTEDKHSTYKNKGPCGVCTSVKNEKKNLRENCEV